MNLKPGSKCFAKVKGYSPWPARIDVLPADVKIPRGKYPVFFYGTHEVSFVTAKDIYDFEKFRHIYGLYKEKNTKFNDAISEIDNNPTVFQLGFDKKAVEFLAQFYKFDFQKLKYEEVKGNTKPLVAASISQRKRQHCDNENPNNDEPKCKVKKIHKIDEKSSAVNIVSNENIVKNRVSHEIIEKEQILQPIQKSILHQIEQPVLQPKKSSVLQAINQPVSQQIEQYVLQPKNETVSQVKKQVLQSVLQTIKQPIQQLTSQTIEVAPEKEKIENILKKENREISLILKDETENNNLLGNSEISRVTKSENINIFSNSFKSPIEASNNERPKRASAIKFKQNFMCYLKSISTNPKFTNKKPDSLIRIKKDVNKPKKSERKSALIEEKIRMKIEKSSANESKHSVDCNHNSPIQTNLHNSIINKDESNLRIVSKLSIIDKEIKRSLIVGQENYEICRKMMNSLLELSNLTLVLLCRVPEIIVTIKKCRRYKKDDSINSSASKIYKIFSQIYEQAEPEEKIEASTELLKRDINGCKSAQMLFNELFVIEKRQSVKQNVPSLVLSSPSSAQSFQSSANNTPLLNNDTSTDTSENGFTLDPDMTDINELLKNGVLVLIDSYSYDESVGKRKSKSSNEIRPFIDDIELYKQLGV